MKKIKIMAVIMTATMIASSISMSTLSVQAANWQKARTTLSDDEEGIPMYRVYNQNSGEHFYTANAREKRHLVQLGWHDEGIGWTAPKKSGSPVYRLYNKNGGEHHYTLNITEKKSLIASGWKDEGIGWYSDEAKSTPVYRQYNPNAFSNNHNYTINEKEKRHLTSAGWKDEGVGWYGLRISIKNVNDLQNIQNNLSGNYMLDADLDLSGRQWTPLGNLNTPFTGTFDGKGHSISGLKVSIDSTVSSDGGLFGFVENGNIQNLKLNNAKIYVHVNSGRQLFSYAGGVAGEIKNGQISKCAVTGEVVSEGENRCFARAAGICACLVDNCSIKDCSVNAAISASSDWSNSMAGGIIAWVYNSTVENCLAEGRVDSNSNFLSYGGGISASGHNGSVKGCVVLSTSVKTACRNRNIHPIGNFVELSDNFAIEDVDGNFSSKANTIFLSSDELSKEETFKKVGWDFSKVWKFDQGKPSLR